MIPSQDMVKGCQVFSESSRVLRELSYYAIGLNEVFRGLDPKQHAAHVALRSKAEEMYPHIQALNAVDPNLMQGKSIIANRATPLHVDKHDPPHGWAALGVVGSFTGGAQLNVPRLNHRTPFNSGDLIFIRGGVLAHEVEPWKSGQRFSIAHFTHMSVWKSLGVELPF